MNDLEMTKRCAEAIGRKPLVGTADGNICVLVFDRGGNVNYDPLHNDEQAMGLVKKLHLQIGKTLRTPDDPNGQWFVSRTDKYEARPSTDLNRAIVECAAMIGAPSTRHADKS